MCGRRVKKLSMRRLKKGLEKESTTGLRAPGWAPPAKSVVFFRSQTKRWRISELI